MIKRMDSPDKNAKKVTGLLRAIAAIMEHWDALNPADQCDMAKIAHRLINEAVKRIEQMRREYIVEEDEIKVFRESIETMQQMIEAIPPHTHDEPS